MSSSAREPPRPAACDSCVRRSWLFAALSPVLDFWARDRGRLLELLALEDEQLLQAVGGRRRTELRSAYERVQPGELRSERYDDAVCRHDQRYPRALRSAAAPRMLHVRGGAGRLAEITAVPVVAVVGSRQASDYGIEMAKSLARGLAATGVTVTNALGDGIAAAAHAGALEVEGRTVAVMDGGLDVACPARRRPLYERVALRGCVASELPRGCDGRRWGPLGSARIVAELAQLTIVVEASQDPRELAGAGFAEALGRTVAAVPGRVTSRQSTGANALLMAGARLVRGPQDALELLDPLTTAEAITEPENVRPMVLAPRLQATLERVGAGWDTPEKLTDEGANAWDVLLALSELELMGLLARGDGGRYVPRSGIHQG